MNETGITRRQSQILVKKQGANLWDPLSSPILTCGQAELLAGGTGLTHWEREAQVVVTAQL